MRRSFHSFVAFAAVVGAMLVNPAAARAQLDPLLFLKNLPPNVVLVVETTNRMQRDADQAYYDPYEYDVSGSWALDLGLVAGEYSVGGGKHRRRHYGLSHVTPGNSTDPKFQTVHIDAVGNLEPRYATFYERTRLALARRGLSQAINDNSLSARFSLVKTRQSLASPAIPSNPNNTTTILDPNQDNSTDAGGDRWKLMRPDIQGGSDNYSSPQSSAWVTRIGDTNATANILATLGKPVQDAGALVPAGADNENNLDTPIGLMLTDAKAEAARLIAADTTGCRNTVVVLVVGGGEGRVAGSPSIDIASKASEFLNVSGRRVPIYVIAIAPDLSSIPSLQAVATNSGGEYFEITKPLIETMMNGPYYTAGQAVPEVARGINRAIQHGFISSSLFNTAPTAALPTGPSQEFQVTSPIIGTVNLRGAQAYDPDTGALTTLPDSETAIEHEGKQVPQRSNVLVTSAFALPGFEARLRALRVYKPVPDTTKPSGYKFVQDGSRLWVASTPAGASRNIYTVLPGSTVPTKFSAENVAALAPYLRVHDPATLIDWIRSRPLGAVVDSTPAFLDPPSLDPPPDADYPKFVEDNKERRSLIFVGLNDGMMHALDARTGVEVWSFIPFNLLPKLRALRSGQSLDAFKFFVDSSPKIADVKIAGEWRTYLFFGQGPGGTFYTALDVTLKGMSGSVSETSPVDGVISFFTSSDRIKVSWTFPRNTSFDTVIAPYGDVWAGALKVEKTVGETWSDPAIGQLTNETGPYVMLVGSGFMKRSMENQPNRENGNIRGGRTFYVIDVVTGNVLAAHDVGSDNFGENDDSCRAANDCSRLKNALQMDPVATGVGDSRFISRIYIGDLDGNMWRFDVSGGGSSVSLPAPTRLHNAGAGQPMFSSMATVNVGGSNQYVFVGTGSDLLPSNNVNDSYKLLIVLDNGGTGTLTSETLLEKTDGLAGDEKVTAFPAVAGDIVFFTTTTLTPSSPCSPYTANLYAMTFIGGPAYDTNNDGRFTSDTTSKKGGGGRGGGGGGSGSADSVLATQIAGARATAPFIVDQHLVFSADDKLQMFGDPEDFNNGVGQAGVRILSWRMVK